MADRSDILARPRAYRARSTALKLDPEAEQVLQDVAEDFVENVAAFACELVKHREGEQLEAKDLQLVLEKNWNMRLPGVGDTSELKAIKKTSSTEVHRQRLRCAGAVGSTARCTSLEARSSSIASRHAAASPPSRSTAASALVLVAVLVEQRQRHQRRPAAVVRGSPV